MRIFTVATFAISIIAVSCSGTKTAITVPELEQHVKYLSSDKLGGRQTGSAGDKMAGEYIKERLEKYGLKTMFNDGIQRYEVTEKVVAGKGNNLVINGKALVLTEDYTPLSFSSSASLSAPVVFAGYGFSIENDSIKWDDYKAVDVNGKWVLILRGDPEPDNAMSPYIMQSGDREKVLLAKDKGASGVLLVSGELSDREDKFDPLSKADVSAGIPVIRIKRAVADQILLPTGNSVSFIEKKINSNRASFNFDPLLKAEATTELIQKKAGTGNVAMVLPGNNEKLKDQYIIVGAHFDHLGMGGPGSSSRKPDTVAVHHGADDNASGVAMIIELAGKFAGTPGSNGRSLVFVAFSGEEWGLLGSKYFADNMPFTASSSYAMVNFDMVGRLGEEKSLQAGGVGTAAGLKDLIASKADTGVLRLTFTDEGSGPSDHSAFYAKNIPVLYFTTGAHEDYHTPEDTWDKINYRGMVDISNLVYDVIHTISNDTSKLVFKEAGPKADVSRGMRRRGITLGIMPDFSGASTNGLRVDLVTPGKPAANGGMKKGDIITAIDSKPVNNIQDYMFRLGQLKKGERITIDIIRANKKEVLLIQL